MSISFHVGRTLVGLSPGLVPIVNCRLNQPSLEELKCRKLRLLLYNILKTTFQGMGDARVKLLSAAFQQALADPPYGDAPCSTGSARGPARCERAQALLPALTPVQVLLRLSFPARAPW